MTSTGIPTPELRQSTALKPWILVLGGAVLVAVFVMFQRLGYLDHANRKTLDFLITQLATLKRVQVERPQLVILAGFALYVAVTGLSLPGAAFMTIAYGWIFGFWTGLVLVSFASTLGAVIAFLLSRYLLRQRFQKVFGARLNGFNTALEREGAQYLFSLRLIPVAPFFVVNVVMGLTPIPARTFWWVSQLGMLPGTAAYVYAGTSLPGLDELRNPSFTRIISPELLFAFALLGIFPLLVKKIGTRFLSKKKGEGPAETR